MTNSDEMMTRYLFGELSESEQAQLEERYFVDAQTFEQLVQLETELVDDYARDHLSPQMRERFERAYLVKPNRRARLRFSEALAAKLDQIAALRVAEQTSIKTASRRQRFFSLLTGGQRALAFSMALVLLLLSSVSVWLFIQSNRLRRDLALTREEQTAQKEREREAQQQLANEQKRTQELATELERRASPAAPQPQPTPSTAERSAPVVASLILTASGVRGVDTGTAPKLVIPQGVHQVRLQLNLRENDYQSYQLVLQAVGGREIFDHHVKPVLTKSGASFIFTLPASKISAGDYMLTLKGITTGGESEDVSQSLFRVEKK